MLVKNKSIVLRTIHGTIFLVDISDNYQGDKCALYEINHTGKFLWDLIDGKYTLDDLAMRLKEAIVDDVPIEILNEDVREFVDSLREKEFILEVAEHG